MRAGRKLGRSLAMSAKKYTTCDPKYYGSGVSNCDNGIKGLRELLDKIKKESADEDKS